MKIERVHKQVIENKLLAALDDDDKVAILCNSDDLDVLIGACVFQLHQPIGAEHLLKDRLREMLADMKKLRKHAFGR